VVILFFIKYPSIYLLKTLEIFAVIDKYIGKKLFRGTHLMN